MLANRIQSLINYFAALNNGLVLIKAVVFFINQNKSLINYSKILITVPAHSVVVEPPVACAFGLVKLFECFTEIISMGTSLTKIKPDR